MLQQILTDMYIDPDVLEALNEEQKKVLFLKMREEQVRRWKEREEKEGKEGRMEKTQTKKGPCKSVSWLLGRDGDVHVYVIGETDEFKSSKLILSELREQNRTDLNRTNRLQTAEPSRSSPSNRTVQPAADPGIELLLNKTEKMSALPDPRKQESDSDQSLEDPKDDSDSSDSTDSTSSHSNMGVYRPHTTNTHTFVTDRLNSLNLQRSAKEQLSVNVKPRPLATPSQERGVVNEQVTCNSYGSRVAQLRMNFNTPNAKPSSPCVKPPVPVKPAHLLAPAPAR
ncbi:hypothetical protein P4O66_015199 [Electrophorus voltai]|uniref:SH2 domain-containing protein n=1 Tax=Electrophorus voltai TaxID=2609070 RepID=A0AAD9DQR7_9TELE|nr:hypothetical protein P4O66_015199 [Electrophorus voltai]